ncbi:MAG: hypothetical protein VX278_11355, partial [Myxococcota bacterium]|nr:hypothetical protein [Myxococcota bacterium]
SLQGLRNNASAESITLKECSYLPESEWHVLLTLPSLQKLGGFRESFSAGILSVLSAKRRDRKIIGKEIVKWRKAAKVFPTEDKLLSSIALAGETLLPDRKGALAICDMIKLSQRHDASDVSDLYRIAFRNSNHTMIQTALEAVFLQEEILIPPSTLLAVSQSISVADEEWARPLFEPIKNTTLRVFCTEVQKEKPAAWLAQTLHVLYVHFNNPHALVPAGFQTEEDTKTQLFQLLGEGKLPATSALEVYGILAEEHISIEEENARTETNRALISIGLSLFENSMRDEALSRLIKSIGKAADSTWSRARLDELLRESMRVNPDASTLLAAVAHSHASAGRWLEMEQVAFTISDIGIRDACLEELSDFLLESKLSDKSRKALSLLNGLQDTKKRLSRLSQLGQQDVLHADPVAYGQLLTLLIEHSETQLQVIQKAISINPELGDIRPSSLNAPVTDREKRLVEMALQQR